MQPMHPRQVPCKQSEYTREDKTQSVGETLHPALIFPQHALSNFTMELLLAANSSKECVRQRAQSGHVNIASSLYVSTTVTPSADNAWVRSSPSLTPKHPLSPLTVTPASISFSLSPRPPANHQYGSTRPQEGDRSKGGGPAHNNSDSMHAPVTLNLIKGGVQTLNTNLMF